jgi:hypothetical protein
MSAMSLLSSPRRRRRLAWLAGVLGVVALILAVFALLPSHGGPANGVRIAPHAPAFDATTTPTPLVPPETPATALARTRAGAIVRPLAVSFVNDLLQRRDLAHAYALLSPELQKRYSLHDWQTGRYLPLTATGAGASTSIAFSGATTVGIVSAIGTDVLFAVRFDKTNGRWLVDYVHQGHGSNYIDDSNYAPAGFLPGSHQETLWTWLALVGGFLGIVAVAAFFESWLRGSRT